MTPIILQEVLKEDLQAFMGDRVHIYIDEPPENKERGKREDMPQIVISLGAGEDNGETAFQKVYVSVGFKDTDSRGSSRHLSKNAIQQLREHFILSPYLPKGFVITNNLKWVMPDGECEPPFAWGGLELIITIPQIEYVDENL